ncbi:MAG: Txe/YoeB family addiction module toxin [Bacteroidia bacterium]|nr:Txe/YoeB family addiction module toxin [Bacteroidia bacterium]
MGKYRVEITKTAKADLEKHFKSGNKTNIARIGKILLELSESPYEGTGNPEQLKYDFKGYWSRRINKKDRLIYRVTEYEVIVYVVSAIGHYNDK